MIIIQGKPIAQSRPRFARRGKFVHVYNDQVKLEHDFMWQAKAQIHKAFSGPVFIAFHFYIKRPKSHFGTGVNSKKIKDKSPDFHITKPDLTNLEKFAEDCLTKLEIWPDDSYIVGKYSTKQYSENGIDEYTEIEIREETPIQDTPF